jgi:SagB-type dehydrogenase family enzyme
MEPKKSIDQIRLPAPVVEGAVSIEGALQARRSVREYRSESIPLRAASQLLWAAQGVTDPDGKRTAPSAGALYPLVVYLVAGSVEGLEAGVYRYRPADHDLVCVAKGDMRGLLAAAAGDQPQLAAGAAAVAIAADYVRTTRKYGDRGVRYVQMEVGHAIENVHLQAISLELGTVVVGAFDDGDVKRVLRVPESEEVLALMPIGRPV